MKEKYLAFYFRFLDRFGARRFRRLTTGAFLLCDIGMLVLAPSAIAAKLAHPHLMRLLFDDITGLNLAREFRIILTGTLSATAMSIACLNLVAYILYWREKRWALLYIELLAIFGSILAILLCFDGLFSLRWIQLLFIPISAIYILHLIGLRHLGLAQFKRSAQ